MDKNNARIVATIEARMTSSRLPGKVLLPAAGKPMLEHLVMRLQSVPEIDEVVIATTVNETDDPVVELAGKLNVPVSRGSEEDVMGRVLDAARFANADIIVEITGDCPIIDPELVGQAIQTYLHNEAEYVGNAHVRSYPDGMDVQVFSREALEKAYAQTNDASDLEHVSLYFRKHPEQFPHLNMIAPLSLYWPELGLTLDEEKDYVLLKKIIEHFAPDKLLFSCGEVISLLEKYPEWVEINRDVARKGSL